jgi:hypothetical protein
VGCPSDLFSSEKRSRGKRRDESRRGNHECSRHMWRTLERAAPALVPTLGALEITGTVY